MDKEVIEEGTYCDQCLETVLLKHGTEEQLSAQKAMDLEHAVCIA
jgi:hypothetical protein